jgi:hypothetical protein
MGDKFVALVGSGRQTCCPSRDVKGLKDWAISPMEQDFIPFCIFPQQDFPSRQTTIKPRSFMTINTTRM